MKKFLICFLTFLCFFNLSFAQSTTSSVLLPDSPLYFLKDIGREAQMLFTFSPVRKAELRLEFANQKLAEANELAETKPDDKRAINKALENYKKETERLTDYTAVLKKGSVSTDVLLSKIIKSSLANQKTLNSIENKITDKEKTQAIKDKALENLTISAFEVAEPEQVKAKLQTAVQNVEDVEVLKKMEEKVSNESEKKALIGVQQEIITQKIADANLSPEELETVKKYAKELSSNSIYQKMLADDFVQKITEENKEALNQLKNIPPEDVQKLNDFAAQILSKNEIDFNEVIKNLDALPLSPQSKDIIDNVQSQIIDNINKTDISCSETINLVCGQNGKEYKNACEAVKAGTFVAYQGACNACAKEGEQLLLNDKRVCCPGLKLCFSADNVRGICKKVCSQ
ncbi:MAG TPA: DUF5667 domain-containing protein [Candidatus Pacearchaeota archaeon]|nr:DUF5667 domain-containing protein [Candidatus Pacearchaeota archaeon]